jgi:hypothetical protein
MNLFHDKEEDKPTNEELNDLYENIQKLITHQIQNKNSDQQTIGELNEFSQVFDMMRTKLDAINILFTDLNEKLR